MKSVSTPLNMFVFNKNIDISSITLIYVPDICIFLL